MSVDGLDVSAEQGNVNWHVTPGILGIAKATEGAYYQDSQLHTNLAGLRAAGKRAGAYHFIRAGMDWGEQARYFLDFLGAPVDANEILALDLEPYPGEPWPLGPDETVADCLVWLERVQEWSGIRPWLYTYPSFAGRMSQASHFEDLRAYPLWWADPSNQNPAPWGPALVQTGQGQVAGVSGDVDLNELGAAYAATLPTQPTNQQEDDVLYSTKDKDPHADAEITTYYRDAGGVLVTLKPEEAAAYFPGIQAGKITVVGLGGGLSALAFSMNTINAQKKAGLLSVSSPH